jgi:hypothetical protein
LNISSYIESGIIERYLLGLTSPEQEEELIHLRRLYPLLDLEITATELRIEDKLQEEAVLPPGSLKDTVLQRVRQTGEQRGPSWNRYNPHEPTNTGSYIQLEPFWNRRISVSVWWRCAFIALAVLAMALAASTWYFYQRTQRLEDVLIKLKAPSASVAAPANP